MVGVTCPITTVVENCFFFIFYMSFVPHPFTSTSPGFQDIHIPEGKLVKTNEYQAVLVILDIP